MRSRAQLAGASPAPSSSSASSPVGNRRAPAPSPVRGAFRFEPLDFEHVSGNDSTNSSLSSSSAAGATTNNNQTKQVSVQPSGFFNALSAQAAAATKSSSSSSASGTSINGGGANITPLSAPDSQQRAGRRPSEVQQQQQLQNFQNYILHDDLFSNDQNADSRKLRLQLYVFVLRCIAYPYNARALDADELAATSRQQQPKLTVSMLEIIVSNHCKYLAQHFASTTARRKYPHAHLAKLIPNYATSFKLLDEAYDRIVFVFNKKMLIGNDKLCKLIELNAASLNDMKDLFRSFASKLLKEFECGSQRAQQSLAQLFADEPSARDLVLTSWTSRFELIVQQSAAGLLHSSTHSTSSQLSHQLQQQHQQPSSASSQQLLTSQQLANKQQLQQFSKEALFAMFQSVLGVKKFEHQLLFNALQLDSTDEQAAAVRRELDTRIQRIVELERNKKLLMPKFVLKEMESLYLDEARACVQQLMINLDKLPVAKSQAESRYGLQKFRRQYGQRGQVASQEPQHAAVEREPSKLDVALSFKLEVVVMEVRGVKQLAPTRELYCTMEVDGADKLQTERVEARKPLWDTQGDFVTSHPLPVLKIKLFAVNASVLALDDKELGRLVLRPTVLSAKTPEWYSMSAPSSSSGNVDSQIITSASSSASSASNELRIKLVVRITRPQQLKHCGFLLGTGKNAWRKLKRRYHVLVQFSQYTFLLCSYKDKKAKPSEVLNLLGFTVDFIEPPTDLIMTHCTEVGCAAAAGASLDSFSGSFSSSAGINSSGSSGGGFGLAGRLANAILKPSSSSSSSVATSSGSLPMQSSATVTDGDSSPDAADTATPADTTQHHHGQSSAIKTAAALSDELHNKHYFNLVREGDSVVFGCDDEQEATNWVMALYRATGQAHKPTPLSRAGAGLGLTAADYLAGASGVGVGDLSQDSDANSQCQQQRQTGQQTTDLLASALLPETTSAASKKPPAKINRAGNQLLHHNTGTGATAQADQRARKHGLDEFIAADACKFNHNRLFSFLQHETIRQRLDDSQCSLGWLSPLQVFVLDEYCARYGVRTCFRHLSYLASLLDWSERRHYFVDHTLLNVTYDFCALYVSGQASSLMTSQSSSTTAIAGHPLGTVNFELLRPSTVATVTVEERDLFASVRCKLLVLVERQIANYAENFPLGKPEGALKAALSLIERVLVKEQQSASLANVNEPVRQFVKKCLDEAALNSYTQLSERANLTSQLQTVARLLAKFGTEVTDLAASQDSEQQQQSLSSIKSTTSTSPSGPTSISSSSSASSAMTTMSSSSLSSSTQHHHHHQNKPHNKTTTITMASIAQTNSMRPRDKLRYLIRLAELCAELVEDNVEHFADSFAWHSDLLADHFELFWSLFTVDMDKVLAELGDVQQQQMIGVAQSATPASPLPPTPPLPAPLQPDPTGAIAQATSNQLTASREVFALFIVLNDHLRKLASNHFACAKFRLYLCEAYKPRLMRHLDASELAARRLAAKAFERELSVNYQAAEKMFAALDELQRFVAIELRWPDDSLADQLAQRIKLIAFELCDACAAKTLATFQALDRKATNKWTPATSSFVPSASASAFGSLAGQAQEVAQLVNLCLETRNKSLKLCTFAKGVDAMQYHAKIDRQVEAALKEMQAGLESRMLAALDATLAKLARHDEGSILAPILSITYKQGMSSSGQDIGKQYVAFAVSCTELLHQSISDELWIIQLLEDWYAALLSAVSAWLNKRFDHSLHAVQLAALSSIVTKVYQNMSLQGVDENKLNTKTYQTIVNRLKVEESSAAAAAAGVASDTSNSSPASSNTFASSLLSSLASTSSSSGPASAGGGAEVASASQSQQVASPSPHQHHHHQQQQQQLQTSGSSSSYSQHQLHQAGQQRSFGSRLNQQPNQQLPNFSTSTDDQQQQDSNLADRALQSASRMFKGFWTTTPNSSS